MPTPTMRIAALSDFHIGATARADQFVHTEDGFLAFLDRLEREHDTIVLVGDVFQAEHGAIPGARAARVQLERAMQRMPRLVARLGGPRYRYVHGNHDEIARAALGAMESVRLAEDGFAAFFVHGHQFDPVFGAAAPLARASTWATGRLRALGLRRVPDWLEGVDVAVKHRRFGGLDGPYVTAARKLLRAHSADVVVMGHTHVPWRLEVPEGVVLGCGTCSGGRRMYVTIDMHTHAAELRVEVG